MPYEIGWAIDKRVVIVRGMGEVTVEEVLRLDQEMIAMMNAGDKGLLVHFIYDATDLPKVADLKSLTAMQCSKHPAFGWNIIVGRLNPIVRFVLTLASKVHRSRYNTFEATDEALAFLAKADATLTNARSA